GYYVGTVNGAPSGGNVPITPILSGAAANGNAIYTGKVSSYHGGGFVGYGAAAPDIAGSAKVSTIKYIGPAAPTTTLGAAANALDTTLTVASSINFRLGDLLVAILDNGATFWTSVKRTPA